jgi:hypothetical protein
LLAERVHADSTLSILPVEREHLIRVSLGGICPTIFGGLSGVSRKGRIMRTSSDVIKAFIDRTFPEVGKDCPNFPVRVILFSAAFLVR